MTKFCKSHVPDSLRQRLEAVKTDSKAVKALGVEEGVKMSRALMNGGPPVSSTLPIKKKIFLVIA